MEVESSDLQRPPAFNCTYEGGCNVGQESRRAMRQAANQSSKRKFFGATKFMMKTGKPVAPAAIQEDNFEEIECFRRLSSISKVPDKVAIAEEQDAFIRTCIRSRSQMISSKKLLEKVRSVQALLNDATSDTTHQTDACISDQARLPGFADETH